MRLRLFRAQAGADPRVGVKLPNAEPRFRIERLSTSALVAERDRLQDVLDAALVTPTVALAHEVERTEWNLAMRSGKSKIWSGGSGPSQSGGVALPESQLVRVTGLEPAHLSIPGPKSRLGRFYGGGGWREMLSELGLCKPTCWRVVAGIGWFWRIPLAIR